MFNPYFPFVDFSSLKNNKRYDYLSNVMYYMVATPAEQAEWRKLIRPLVLNSIEKHKLSLLNRNKETIEFYRKEAILARKEKDRLNEAHRLELKADILESFTEEQLKEYIDYYYFENRLCGYNYDTKNCSY
jgi:hypothetical protein